MKIAHINRIKYYDPENSKSDKDTHISYEDNVDTEIQKLPSVRMTRTTTNNLPPPIDRYTSANRNNHNPAVAITRQKPHNTIPLWESNNKSTNNAKFADEFRALFGPK